MNGILKELYLNGIVPVIKIEDPEQAEPLAEALVRGGLACAEVTFRTAAAKEAISRISKSHPDMLLGAGTVLTTAQADEAVEAGAKFIVTPGFNPEVVRYCLDRGYPIVPGINNPSGIEQALSFGLDTVKFFPAEQSGGIRMIKAMSAPYGAVKFMPTGGINAANLNDYLAFPKILCCGGSWMVDAGLIAKRDFAGIERLVREAVDTMLGFRLKHVGVNCASPEDARSCTDMLTSAFSFVAEEKPASTFVGSAIELMNAPGRGRNGHIAIETNNVEKAVYQLTRRGVRFDSGSEIRDKSGTLKLVYLAEEIGGFAYHLCEKG